MLAFFIDWGSGQKIAFVIISVIALAVLVVTFLESNDEFGYVIGVIIAAVIFSGSLAIIMSAESGRRETEESRRALE